MGTTALETARALTHHIRASAADIERTAQLTASVVEQLFESGMFGLLLPKDLGGTETPLPDFIEIVEQLSFADASVAWSIAQANVFSTHASRLSPHAANEIFGDAATAMVHGPPKTTTAIRVDGGFKVTGTWGFGTGIGHSSWLAGRCDIEGEKGTYLLVMFPKERAPIIDNWDVRGLTGTGSHDFAVDDLFVPLAHTMSAEAEAHHDSPLYHLPVVSMFAVSFAAVALGTSLMMFDHLLSLAKSKTADHMRHTLAVDPHMHEQVGMTRAVWSAARHYLHGEVADVWADLVPGRAPTMEHRVRLRLCGTHALREARRVADLCWEMAGTSEIHTGSEFHRRYQDMIVISQHLQARTAHYPTVGRYTLGDTVKLGVLI